MKYFKDAFCFVVIVVGGDGKTVVRGFVFSNLTSLPKQPGFNFVSKTNTMRYVIDENSCPGRWPGKSELAIANRTVVNCSIVLVGLALGGCLGKRWQWFVGF